MGTIKPQGNGPLYNNTVIGTLAVDGWAVPNVTAHPSTASVATLYYSMLHYNYLWILKGLYIVLTVLLQWHWQESSNMKELWQTDVIKQATAWSKPLWLVNLQSRTLQPEEETTITLLNISNRHRRRHISLLLAYIFLIFTRCLIRAIIFPVVAQNLTATSARSSGAAVTQRFGARPVRRLCTERLDSLPASARWPNSIEINSLFSSFLHVSRASRSRSASLGRF